MTQAPKKPQSISNYTIENYIQRVSELSQSGHQIPTNEELEKIAAELGISSEEIEIAQKQSQDHFLRAQGYFSLKYWDEAINELQEAVVFNPSNLELLNLLANAHLGRWHQKHRRDDELQIKTRIKQCLQIKPDHQESLQLLAKLDRSIQQHHQKKVLFTALFSVFIGSIIGYFFLNDISLNIFTDKDVKLEKLKLELVKEIDELRKQQDALWNQFVNNEQKKQQLNQEKLAQSEGRIQKLEQENKSLNQKIIFLQKRIETLNKYLINKEKDPNNEGQN
jgi:tetratricopeptide (TPR) repeat protein